MRAGRVAQHRQRQRLGGFSPCPFCWFRNSGTASRPVPCTALICATGAPSSRASFSVSIWPPRDSIRSLMFSSTSVGSPTASTGAASISCRVRCSESSTSRTASGLGVPGMLPAQHVHGDARIF